MESFTQRHARRRNKKRRSPRRKINRFGAGMETLERRCLLTGSIGLDPSGTMIVIEGDNYYAAGGDTVEVSHLAGRDAVRVDAVWGDGSTDSVEIELLDGTSRRPA